MPTREFVLEDGTWWTTTAVLPSWSGFQRRDGPYGAASSTAPSSGEVKILFAPEGRGNEPLTANERSLVGWIVENEALVADALLKALWAKYPELQHLYACDEEEMAKYLPDVNDVQGFRHLIGLHCIHVHPLEADGMPYAGYELGCTWDAEHGLGVLMHGTKVLEIGGADTALLLWLAEQYAKGET